MKRIALILGSNISGALPLSDRAAVGLATRRLTGDVHAFAPRDDEDALRYALAAGAASAAVLQRFNQLDFDIALVGDGGCGAWGDLLPAKIAAECSAALVLNAIDVEFTPDGFRVTRDFGRGAKEILRVRGRAVLCVSEDAPQRMYVSRYRRQTTAARATVASTSLVDPLASAATAWEPARARTRTGNLAAKTGGAATDRFNSLVGAASTGEDASAEREIIQADAATCAKHLLRYLRHHGFAAGAALEPAPFLGRGQSEGLRLPSSPSRSSDQRREEPHPSPLPQKGEGVAPRLLRGPRGVTGETRGVARRPRAIEIPAPDSLPPKLARAPRTIVRCHWPRFYAPSALSPIGTKTVGGGVPPTSGTRVEDPRVRRPRPLESSSPAVGVLPPKLARRPRSLNQTSPRARGPFSFPFPFPFQGSSHG